MFLGVLHGGPVLSVAWSPDGLRVVSGSEDYHVRVLSASTGEIEHVVGVFECVLSASFVLRGCGR